MIAVNLDKGKYKILPDKGLKILKKKLMKEGTLKDLRAREYFVSDGRKAYLARAKKKHIKKLNSK